MSAPTIVTPHVLRDWPLPSPGSSKGSRGRVLVVGGARRTPGAALLAGRAALRVGAGVLTFAVASSVAVQVAVAVPEAGTVGLAENAAGSVTGDDLALLDSDLSGADAVLVGPGLDDADLAEVLLRGLLPRIPDGVPVVLDAFALGVLDRLGDAAGAVAGRLILTPNQAEAHRLLGQDPESDVEPDLAEVARRYGAVVYCQQSMVNPAGERWEGSSGHGGLGTSGSGDVLAGAVCGLLARGASLEQAACWAGHLHATAGDRLAIEVGPLGFLAGELADRLPLVMAELAGSRS
ncbi:NAD(P)H-hydrate dehydratase [Nakamurella deserti]|uniref:NAD(P)H-hydrate dehydratase n=1 Tax=Nakamurella deserti TaxID=2164074 RepID=UPI000DBE92CB|nr:NAD(P)H-hydrate dehydratase [Nakamurella deserti]